MKMNEAPKLTHTNFITEIKAFIKIEKGGQEQSFLPQKQQHCIRFVENTYKYNDDKEKKILEFEIRIKDKNGKRIYTFLKNHLIKIYNQLACEGLLTLLMDTGKDQYKIFVSKSAKEVIEHFLSKINTYKDKETIITLNQNNNNNNKNIEINNNDNNKITKTNNTINNQKKEKINNKINNNKKEENKIEPKYNRRRFNELFKEKIKAQKNLKQNIISVNTEGFQLKNEQLIQDLSRIRKEYSITLVDYFSSIYPDYLCYQIFKYLDKKTILFKIAILNKEIKHYSDTYITNIKLHDDTPKEIFSRLLSRFPNITTIELGKAKNFKNFHIKEMLGSLKLLQHIDLSYLEKINDESIRKLLTKTKGINIKSIKLNAFLDSLHEALCYAYSFYKNMTELSVGNKDFKYDDKTLKFINENPRYYRKELTNIINKILDSKEHKLKKLNFFIFNGIIEPYSQSMFKGVYIQNKLFPFPFKNLVELGIDIIIIKEIKELQIFYNCNNLEKFRLGEIIIKNKEIYEYIDIDKIHEEQLILQEKSNGEIDFDNEPTEVFGRIFYNLKNVKEISFGRFLNKELCKLISVYLLKTQKISFSSPFIDDDSIKEIFIKCKKIKEINLEGCIYFDGSCFFEMKQNEYSNLSKARFSINSFNVNRLIEFLRSKGIDARNVIKKEYL